MDDRNISFEKIFNARDMGGLRTAQGCIISSGFLIRSANLSDVTEADKKVLREKYHLSKIIDLRTEMERKEMPDVSITEVDYLPIPIFDKSVAGISHEKRNSREQILAVIPKMGDLYCKMVTDPPCRENLGKAARSVMEHDFSKGSVLWHCTEGKDRCGLLSMVLLMALGVKRSTIMEDYLLTNRVNEAKSEKYYHMMISAGKTKTEAETIRDIFLAKEEYLDAAFSAMDAQYENAGDFLRDGLNIPQIKMIYPEATYLVWVDCNDLGLAEQALEDLIIKQANLWLDSGHIFGKTGNGFQRFNVACPRKILKQALEQLKEAIN